MGSEMCIRDSLKGILKIQRGIAIKLLTGFMVGKKRDALHSMLSLIKERGDNRQHLINNKFRKGIRSMIKIVVRKKKNVFHRIMDTRVILDQNKKLRSCFKIVKEIRIQNVRWAFVHMRR